MIRRTAIISLRARALKPKTTRIGKVRIRNQPYTYIASVHPEEGKMIILIKSRAPIRKTWNGIHYTVQVPVGTDKLMMTVVRTFTQRVPESRSM